MNLCGREYGIAGHSDIHSESFRHSDRNSESKPILKVFFNFPCFSLIFVEFQHFRMWCHVVVWALRKVAGDDGSKGWEPRDFVVEMSTHLSQGQRVIGAASQGHPKKTLTKMQFPKQHASSCCVLQLLHVLVSSEHLSCLSCLVFTHGFECRAFKFNSHSVRVIFRVYVSFSLHSFFSFNPR